MSIATVILRDNIAEEFLEAIHSCQPVIGLTHDFYRYPARFSPLFARAAIKAFTQPGDIVFDPFMGGGTTLVEARTLGRRAIGVDISELANFITRVKTTILSEEDIDIIYNWAGSLDKKLNLRNRPIRAEKWIEKGYQRNITGKNTWPIRKTIELAIAHTNELDCDRQQRFARCVLLKTGQWALDSRKEIPPASEFRKQFFTDVMEMSRGVKEFSVLAQEVDHLYKIEESFRILCLCRSVIGIDNETKLLGNLAPKLILTSPPYPGVHVLYHRWQVQGRKETPAPFWIADSLDGQGASFYTLGDRKRQDLVSYYDQIYKAFGSLAQIATPETLLLQMVAFSDPSWQLDKYLQVIGQAGFTEIKIPVLANSPDGRLWRHVPNRKWYADQKGIIPSSKEVVLFHKLS